MRVCMEQRDTNWTDFREVGNWRFALLFIDQVRLQLSQTTITDPVRKAGETQWRIWLKHCTMPLGFTQPLAEMRTTNITWE